jgi:acetylornithine/N-succinyldiaminopimelate aminotransferase
MLSDKELFLRYLGQTSPSPLLIEIERASGVFMYGPDGKQYLDLISGVSVSNVGHNHPKVIRAIHSQAESYTHLMVYGELVLGPQLSYARKLASVLPGNLSSCYFVNSGSEAVEGAMKLAKRFTGRTKIVSFRNSYHGSTHGALSIQGSEIYRNAFRPLLPDTVQIQFNNEASLSVIDNKTACVIAEPVQGEAGYILPENGFLSKLRKRCDESGALLIFDEIQTGFGRTGAMFAALKYNVNPDIILLAKALGGGMPLGAFISSTNIMKVLSDKPVLGHITTFGGHPVSCAAGEAALQVITDEDLAAQSIVES